jgi:Domain of unknown function (DUF4382)
MQFKKWSSTLFALAFLAAISGCGSGSSSNTLTPPPPQAQSATVSMIVSDASSEDWAGINVKVLGIALVPQDGGSNVTVYTAPNPAPAINLVQLDQLGEILGNVTVPAGTYTGAQLTIAGNPGDVSLVVSADPESGFAGTPGATIPSSQIQIQHTTGGAGSLTVPVNVKFDSPLLVTANQNDALDIEFDLAHPAFIVGHVPPSGGGATLWAVNFNGPVRRRNLRDITRLILRHMYGSVTSIASDNTAITITRNFPVEPPTNPETSVASSQSLSILADATNGTLFYDVDAKTSTTIKDFASVASSLTGKFVRIAARYQQNGTLVAVRIWASTSFNGVWISPEGHVLHVNSGTDIIMVANELGSGVRMLVDTNTKFFFRTPWDAVADSTPIATGTGLLNSKDFVRGFKVHASVVDPLAVPLVAQSIDIEIARFSGTISSPTTTGFTYTHDFHTVTDDYVNTLEYISSSTPNGKDSNGNPITGFKWWNFTFPTLADTGANAITDYINVTNGKANFGGSVGAINAWGESYARWNDPASPSDWAAAWTVLLPTPLPRGNVAAGYSATNNNFTMTITGGVNAVPVDLNTTSGSGTLVYQVDRTGGIVTVSSVDITTTAGQTTILNNLIANTPVKVFGVPQADGSIKGYVVIYYTGVSSMD